MRDLVIFLLAVAPALFGQVATLTLSPGADSGTANLVLVYNSADPADGIAEMQWMLTHQKDFPIHVAAGQAAKDAGKELLCSPVADGTKCLLIGKDEKTIRDGVVAEVSVKFSKTTIGLTKTLGITAQGKSIPIAVGFPPGRRPWWSWPRGGPR